MAGDRRWLYLAPLVLAAVAVLVFLFGGDGDTGQGAGSTTSTSQVTTSTTQVPTTTTTPTTTPPTTVPPAPQFPTPDSVGLPDGLTPVVRTGDWVVTQDGLVIDGREIRGNLIVRADDVTVTRTRVLGTGRHVVHCDGCRDLLIEDSELIGVADEAQNCLAFSNYTVRRSLLSGCIDGAKANGDSVLEGNWIGNLRRVGSSHNDGVQSTGGAGVVIRGNTIVHDTGGQTSAIKVSSENRPLVDVLVEGNRITSSTCRAMYFTRQVNATDQPLPTGQVINNVVDGHTCADWLARTPGPDQVVAGNVDPSGQPLD